MTRHKQQVSLAMQYQLPLELWTAPSSSDVPDYTWRPVKWDGGRTIGVFEVPGEVRARTPSDVAQHLFATIYKYFDAIDQEHLWVLALDTRNNIRKQILVYRGSINTTVVRVGELFKDALRFNAAGVILVHNHPSGGVDPSPEDVRVTELAVEAGELLGVKVMDHIIIGRGLYVSLKERGLGFK